MHNFRKMILVLTASLVLASRGFAATAIASITITGAEQSTGNTWDTGTVTATLNGVSVYFVYGQFSTPAAIASALGALISQNCNSPVYARATGAVLNFYTKGTNILTSATITSTSDNPSLFPANSFLVAGSKSISFPQITGLSFDPVVGPQNYQTLQGPPLVGFVINGSNFGPDDTPADTYVTLNGIELITNSWSPGQIIVQVPANAVLAAPAALTVFVKGISATGSATFQVTAAIVCP
jgi:hypothetical protein